jgi:hypothetical protein
MCEALGSSPSTNKVIINIRAWCHTSVIPALKRQEDFVFKASMGYKMRTCLKKKKIEMMKRPATKGYRLTSCVSVAVLTP